jgi:hypothetical protein
MLAHALLVVIASTERADHPSPGELIALSCNEIRHLFTNLITEPTALELPIPTLYEDRTGYG